MKFLDGLMVSDADQWYATMSKELDKCSKIAQVTCESYGVTDEVEKSVVMAAKIYDSLNSLDEHANLVASGLLAISITRLNRLSK